MAEFCLQHLNEMLNETLSEKDVVLEMDLCESCGEIKACVMSIKKRFYIRRYFQELFKKKQ